MIGRIASGAHGIVDRAELLGAGLTPGQIKQRLRTGVLLTEHPGVYRVGHRAPSTEARYLAAVRAAGPGAVLSGWAAAHLLGLLRQGRAPVPEVTAPTERRVRGVIVHRSRTMDPRDAFMWDGIPVMTPARVLVDIAADADTDVLARACHEAGVCHHTTPADVEAVLARRPTAPGAGRLRRIGRGEHQVVLSRLEGRFLERLEAAGLPLPRTNRPAGGRRVDCRWPGHRVTVELDSYRYHRSRHAWEQDRRREREAYTRGDAFRRYTWGDVFEHPAAMMAEPRELLPVRPG